MYAKKAGKWEVVHVLKEVCVVVLYPPTIICAASPPAWTAGDRDGLGSQEQPACDVWCGKPPPLSSHYSCHTGRTAMRMCGHWLVVSGVRRWLSCASIEQPPSSSGPLWVGTTARHGIVLTSKWFIENKFAVGSGARLISICYFEKENDWWVHLGVRQCALFYTVCCMQVGE